MDDDSYKTRMSAEELSDFSRGQGKKQGKYRK